MALLLISQLVAFSLFPLYFTTISGPLRRVHFYVYISLVLLIGGFMGNVYSLPITDDIVISGGNLCYGAFMMTSVMFVWIEKDAFILRHLVRLVVLVDIFNIIFSFLTHSILETRGIVNPHGVPSDLFAISTPLIALGGFLIVAELLLLLFIFELTKKRKSPLVVTATIYILSFMLVLILDGIAFPFIAFGISAEIAAIVFGGLDAKILMAVAYSVPLALFVMRKRQAFADFLAVDTVRWRLLASSSTQLIKEMASKDQDVRRGNIVFRNSTEGLAIVDHEGNVLKANHAFQAMLEIKENTASIDLANAFWIGGKPVILPQSPKEQWRREIMFGRDRKKPGILSITPAGEDTEGAESYVYSLTDITEQKNTQEKLEYLASHDHLTGLLNRHALDKSLSRLQNIPHTLIILDLDRFKDINDSYGHGVGDRVLRIIADRLNLVRKRDLVADDVLCRIGGDEFAFLIHSSDNGFIRAILEDIQAIFSQTVRIENGLEFIASATIGVSSRHEASENDLLLEADAALYEAKRNKRGSYAVYEEGLTAESQKRMKLSLKLKNALAAGQVDVHYQPQFDTVTHALRGIEALVRWTDPELGVIPPCDFIPVAEETGLIDILGEYVLEKACRDGQEWLENGHTPVTISVNISASQLRFGRFTSVLRGILEQTGFPAGQLGIEITESTYIEREDEVTPLLRELKDMGVQIALDDFGTGYSSLSYLREIPCDCIKIDRSFVVGIPDDEKQCNLIAAIINLAKVMSFKVVVEGVETREQLDFLTARECDLIQGYYFSPAISKEKITALLI
ncbi:putative bifunctional diguanylate cyclase/phosphodiesterase [Rhizobium sp. SYY.PMSO]|uniref:putative bifunctional diguanylate cyclase/phosphodiesterase n=1 Tax=Rhizobium sp. SYY.PMSO TaxID=3382192 RepID=UPI00398FDEC5